MHASMSDPCIAQNYAMSLWQPTRIHSHMSGYLVQNRQGQGEGGCVESPSSWGSGRQGKLGADPYAAPATDVLGHPTPLPRPTPRHYSNQLPSPILDPVYVV